MNENEITADFLNEKQKKYFVASKLDAESKNTIFIGLLRKYRNEELNQNLAENQDKIIDQIQNNNILQIQNDNNIKEENQNNSKEEDTKNAKNINNESNQIQNNNDNHIQKNNESNNNNNSNENSIIIQSQTTPKIIKFEEINDFYDVKECFALKLLPYNTQEKIEKLENERIIQDLFLDDDPIIKYKDFIEITFNNDRYIIVVMNLYVNFDLLFYMTRPIFNYDENFICVVSYKCLLILKNLKERHIVHNDIKYENFIVVSENPIKIYLTDFESAQIIQENEYSNFCEGTTVFESPEVLRKKPHDYAADMWSLGVNIYQSLFDCYPFDIDDDDDSEKVVLEKIEKNTLKKFDSVSDDAWECIELMLKKNPLDRISPEDALNLNWFRFIESAEIKAKTNSYDIAPLKFETTKG